MGKGRYQTLGKDLFQILHRISNNQTICRLLYYTDSNPLSSDKPNIDGTTLINQNIKLVPALPDDHLIKECYLVITFRVLALNYENPSYKTVSLKIDVVCPFDEWIIQDETLRPLAIMEELDKMFNEIPITGVGRLINTRAELLVLSKEVGNYTMEYTYDSHN